MSCHHIKINDSIAILCCADIYKYKHNGRDFYFEWHRFMGPIPVSKNSLEPRKTIPTGFWDMVAEFQNLSEKVFYFLLSV
jgi:hypothetical protein